VSAYLQRGIRSSDYISRILAALAAAERAAAD
jgi:hypothetical protein